jgi:hypothetical protein
VTEGSSANAASRINKKTRDYDIDIPLPIAIAKFIVRRYAPRPMLSWASGVYFSYLRHRLSRPGLVVPIAERLGFTVQAGPFAGMTYPREIVHTDGLFMPKLLGCYEMECHPYIEKLCARSYDQVINIGAAEGYYSVGLARRMPAVKVIAYETEPKSRELCVKLARMNGVEDRIEQRGFCDRESLAVILKSDDNKRTLILSDCEGAELELLDPGVIGSLKRSDLLVELHDVVNPEISRTLAGRFAATHRLEKITSSTRDPSAYPALNELKAEDREFLLSEHRKDPMDWLFCTAL